MDNRLKPVEHGFKRLFFRLASPMLRRKQGEFVPLDGSRLRKVLFLRPEKIGDMVISFPVFDGLKRRFPHIEIAVMGSPRNRMVIEGDPRFSNVYMYTKKLRDISTVREIRREKFDCVVDMICDDSVTALFLSQFTAPGKPRIGVGKVRHREFYDFNYDHRRGNTGHIIENTLKLLTAFGIDPDSVSRYAPPYVSEPARAKAAAFTTTLHSGKEPSLTVGYNLSAGSPTRVWAQEKAIELLRRILERHDDSRIVLFTVPGERRRAEALKAQLDDRIVLVPDNMSLMEASAVIGRMDVFISPDTSLVHIARSFRVPVVGLYSRYQKNFLLWRPYDQEVGAVVSGHDDNIFDITVDQVFETFGQVVARYATVED